MADFKVKKPEYTSWQWIKSIGSRIIFPPILLWDLLKFGVNKLVGKLVGSLVLPAQDDHFLKLPDDMSRCNTQILSYEKHTIETHDGVKLDTLEVIYQSQLNFAKEHQSYIINFVGNGMAYEQIFEDMLNDAYNLKSNVIGFNLRGVGNSSGRARSKDDLVTDGIAQVQRLLDQGASIQNITLKGHSLGAGIASLVAHHFHTQGQPINLFNGRSFSSISNNVIGWVRTGLNGTGHIESFGWKLLGWIAMPFVKFGIALSKWEINAGSAYKKIPEAYKDYTLVRTRKSHRDENTKDDPVIPHYASLHNSLKNERKARKRKIDDLIRETESVINLGDNITKVRAENAISELREARERFKERKMEADPKRNGHAEDMNEIKNRSDKTALTFFMEFVQRAHDDHAIVPPQFDI